MSESPAHQELRAWEIDNRKIPDLSHERVPEYPRQTAVAVTSLLVQTPFLFAIFSYDYRRYSRQRLRQVNADLLYLLAFRSKP